MLTRRRLLLLQLIALALSAVTTVLLPWSVVGEHLALTGITYGEGKLLLCLLAGAALTSIYTLLREIEGPRPQKHPRSKSAPISQGPLWPTGLLSLGAGLTATWGVVDLSRAVGTISEVMALLPPGSRGLLSADTSLSVGPGAWLAAITAWLAFIAVTTATRLDRGTG